MPLFSRGRRLDGVRERVLASAAVAEGHELCGTRAALHVVPADGGAACRFGWEHVHSAGWDAATSTLTLRETRNGQAEPDVHTFVLADASARLLDLVHERVQASVVLQRSVPVTGGDAQVVLRRSPDGRGPVFSSVLWPGVLTGADVAPSTASRAAVQEAVEQMCQELGLDAVVPGGVPS